MALLKVTESLCAARASSRSSVLILRDLSSAFDIVNHQTLLFILAELDCWHCSNLVHIIPDKSHLSGYMKHCPNPASGNWRLSRLSIRTAHVFTIHQVTRLCNHITWMDTQLFPSLPPSSSNTHGLADISAWIAAHHLKLNLGETKHPGERLPLHGPVSHCQGCHGIAIIDDEEPRHNPQRWTEKSKTPTNPITC